MTPPLLQSLFSDPVLLSRIQAEADFALSEISDHIDALPAGARVLEIGCGTGFLLARLLELRPDLQLVGLEPIGGGFASFEQTLDRITTAFPSLTIHRIPVEDFGSSPDVAAFDFVFSLNVFEHLQDWRRAVNRVAALLAPQGQMLVLCPNYLVPYEPHFGIPTLYSADLAKKVFARRIAQVEQVTNSAGLWESINFISVPAFRRHCRAMTLDVTFERGMLAKMLDRLGTDPEFAARQAGIAGIARLFRALGGIWLSRRLPPDLDPYMKAHVRLRPPEAPDLAVC
ncbi:Cyclopropane fatty-acyl-phospholipid synthase [Jannaschia faecimaris]|uniref:Cyclopropane fatty-acyl-phospholipid synthase n=1 Tax=Jannaschia faecimaris TaxID=1244108 RepID=A0A1H3JRA3_9RHOB|nr:methyltransferase domain-containing protein [Jannaschia faecimaris]SDY41898.1 Cyclopropane fatty-acyl-phospholipid synthase [Jannaschia faecimaris]